MTSKFILNPYYYGQPLAGLAHLATQNWDVNHPDKPLPIADPANLTPQETMARMIEIYRPLALWTESTIKDRHCAVALSGDCSSSFAVLTGVQNAGLSPTFIWFDAHGDFNTWETTPSGYLGGMPLAIVSGRGEQMIPRALKFNNIPDEQIILTDARELDPGEVSNLADSEVTHLTDVSMLLDTTLPDRPISIHFDVDVINHNEASAMEFPTQGGPSVAMLSRVFKHLASTKRIVSVSISSWVPHLDSEGQTETAVMGLLQDLVN